MTLQQKLCVAALALLGTVARGYADELERAFSCPPEEARPLMIWQWMDGVVSREGITADLEAYAEAGLGGVQQFHVGGPMQGMICDTTNAIGSQNWQQLMTFAISECRRLGLSFGTHNCPGWSSSAYPTVEPAFSMQKLVWTDTVVDSRQVAQAAAQLRRPVVDARWNYYEDVAMLALPADSTVALADVRVLPASVEGLRGPVRVMRFGHTTNGKTNQSTAPRGGVGLECDKMSREAVRRYWDSYPAMLLRLAGNDVGATFQRLEIDSYEAGTQDWTVHMPAEFSARRGYDLLPWLPALAGFTIDDKARTKQFKADFVATATDLFADNYYGYMGQLCREHGLKLLAQPYGTGSNNQFNPINTDKIARQSSIDLLCAEFWTHPNWGWKDVPRVVNAARRNGHEVIYAEGFTCWPLMAWQDDPASLKHVADRAFAAGLNRLMLHAGAHNPWTGVVPGMTFGKWGTQWTPGQTWWRSGAAKLLFSYFARCQALLQRGTFVDDATSRNRSLQADAELLWTHRRDAGADLFFIANPKDSALTTIITVPIAGREPEIWNPETGDRQVAQAWQCADGATQVALPLTEGQAVFMVFRHETTAAGPGLTLPAVQVQGSVDIAGPWQVSFPSGYDAPDGITFQQLTPWNEHSDAGIRYFSGTACYTTTFRMKRFDASARYLLDLGLVKNTARVLVNGVEVAHLWHPPFRCDVTPLLRKGRNVLQVEVTNLWPNRMIGDEQWPDDTEWGEPFRYDYAPGKPIVGSFMKRVPGWLSRGEQRPSEHRKTVVSFKFFREDSPLLPSGLLGPVSISVQR